MGAATQADAILVTGGAGYIGSHVCQVLCDAGRQVVVLDDLSRGHRRQIPPGVTFVQGDIADDALVGQLIASHGIGWVMHFAGRILVPDSMRDPVDYYTTNVAKSLSLIATCARAGIRGFVFSSTAAVYGTPAQLPVTEDTPCRPMSPYGHSKLMIEQMLADIGQVSAMRFVCLRYFNVAGADPQGRRGQREDETTHLIRVACQAAVGRRAFLEVFGDDYDTPDGTCIRDFIHVCDLAGVHYAALGYLDSGGKSTVINCGYGHGYSIREVIAAVERVTGRPLPVRQGGRRDGDIPAMVAAVGRMRALLDWSPRYDDLDQIIRTALAWEESLNRTDAAGHG
ncbi:UDP-glucose 4-epimerase GalE [Magnetospirillum moscoviense]|uniref:UDP-glucose 4-epimerase n=1 Tax=Magnetospirillum moscoviense TaxID=1437059 RepID=A0A178MYL1_9PROT|nr:UDP-glucose 4-epimerase GalE [Magnetospirillum moscoviense]OAN55038.1 UDP-glucose 4-epimerase GalE [Magnetospirillum moscoviense]